MATGGNYPFKSASTDPRPRGSWQRTTSNSDKDDNVSLNSIPNELRPNNWDFSDWKPSAPFDNTKRRKKGNPEREREQSLSQDSPPPFEHHQRTPSTFPRTRITPSTPTSQRIALENLRQQLTFSDLDDGGFSSQPVSNDGEKNNERNIPTRRGQLPNFTRQDMSRSMEEMGRAREDVRKTQSSCTNNNRDNRQMTEGPDGGQIVGRLMQIRDYIKQANSMMDALKKSGSPQTYREDLGKLRKLLDNLQEQESAYLGLLQQLLSSKEDASGLLDGINQREETPRPESAEDSRSIDIDVQSETSETTSQFRARDLANTEDMLQNTEEMLYNHLSQERAISQTRPRIEDKLGLTEEEEDEDRVEASPYSEAMDSTLVQSHETAARQEWDFEDKEMTDDFMELGEGGGGGGLEALKLQEHLLRKLREQQEQMKALKGRQAALLALQKDAEHKLAEARAWDMKVADMATGSNNSLSTAVQGLQTGHRHSSKADGDPRGRPDVAMDGVPRDEIRQHRSYLRNELKEQNTDTTERQSNPELEAASGVLEENRQQLQDKLRELQQKKQTMDSLLQELNSLRSERFEVLSRMNNETTPPGEEESAPPAVLPQPNITASAENQDASLAEPTEAEAEELRNILDAREKLKKLQDVKEKLNQLRSLVDYYQTSTEDGQIPDVDERTAFQNMIEGYSQGLDPRATRPSAAVQESSQGAAGISTELKRRSQPSVQSQSKSDENNESDSESSDESNLSSLGPWGDDPEIQEKVRKLKAAKEKLKQLQEIVSKVQQSPYGAEALPENIAELAASLDEGETQFSQAEDKNNSVSDGEVSVKQTERDAFYEAKMQEQLRELDQLKEERNRLLSIQQELQNLHDRCGPGTDPSQEEATEMKTTETSEEQNVVEAAPPEETTNGRPSKQGVPSVTFSSNDEVYGKMRKQRMLREELRQKKRELEAIMKKDGSRKQYGKNQDNQSDTVSYTTDAFGAPSADATMATWGGSTVDNLESITEDEDGQQANKDMEEDDAYPSDGILQVEEEEEENDSDNDTYTIENDVRQRRKAREQQRKAVKEGAKPKKKQTFPRSQGRKGAIPKQTGWSRSYGSRQGKRNRQETNRTTDDVVQDDDEVDNQAQSQSPRGTYEALQQQLERTSSMCQSLLHDQTGSNATALQTSLNSTGFGVRSPGPDMLQQQLQQQQFMMSLNQCLQQMSMQQMEMQNMQRQMQNLSLQVVDQSDWNLRGTPLSTLPEDLRFRSLTSLPTGFDSRGLSPNIATRGDSFSMQPRFPSEFHSRRSNDNLLNAVRQESNDVFESERSNQVYSSRDQHRMAVRSKTGSYSQLESTRKESSSGNVKRKTSSLSERSRRNNPQQNLEETPELIPSLNLQDMLKKKKRQNLPQNLSAPSSFPSSMDASPDVTRNAEGVKTSTSQRAGLGRGQYRPGLSAGISGAGFQLENSSIASTMSNRVTAEEASASRNAATANLLGQRDYSRDINDPGDLSLFEALRESIYSEVATLISQNENRPHFLIELFRELQSVSSDYLRQRILYSIKDIVSKYLTEQNSNSVAAPPPAWINTNALNYTASELTPSESLLTSDEEEVKLKARETISSSHKSRLLNRGSSLQNEEFDYMENADNDSSLSTPSNSYWDNPFAQESLGDTVIHLDKALKRMKEYDRKIAEGEAKQKAIQQQREMRFRDFDPMGLSEPTSSSAVDQGSESSVSSVSYPKIDTQQLDQQIKSIMTEVIPVVKEHMDHVCSSQLLAYIKRLVLSLTRKDNSNSQYSRFFHGQMSSTLQDTLAKFEGRKMRECSEDLIVDMSEALFNELAFFRLMEGIGEPPNLHDDFCSAATQTHEEDEEGNDELGDGGDDHLEESDTTETTATVSDDDDDVDRNGLNNSVRANAMEEEELGKARDDEFAKEIQIQDAEDKDNEQESPYKTNPVQIELAPSETKPFTRIGSDEDSDEDADESQSADDPSETAVSHMMDQEDGTTESMMDEEAPTKDGKMEDADQGTQSNTGDNSKDVTKDSQLNGHVNGEIMENGEVTLDDLPVSMNIPREQIQNKMNEEQQNNNAESAALEVMDVNIELAGDGQFLKEPGA